MRDSKVLIVILLGIIYLSSPTYAKEFVYSASDNLTGKICAEIIREAHERIGFKVKIIRSPAKRTLVYANSGVHDGAPCRIKTIVDDYPNLVRVGPSYIAIDSYAYTKDVELEVNSMESLRPYMTGIHLGHKYAENLTKGLKVTKIGDDVQLVRMLEFGSIDIAILIEMDALMAMKETNLRIIQLQPAVSSLSLYFYFHKKNMEYIQEMEKSIQDMVASGRSKEIQSYMLKKELEIEPRIQ